MTAGEGFNGNVITGIGTPANNGKDIDIDGDALTVGSFMIGSTILTPGQVFTQDNGETTLSLDSFGNISGILAPGSNGFPAISYIISDGHGGSSSASVTVQAIV